MSHDFSNITNLFKTEMMRHGIAIDREIIADGILHRAHIVGDKGCTCNAWYVLHPSGLPCGVYGNWKTGVSHRWCAKSFNNMTTIEKDGYVRKINEARKQYNEELLKKQLDTSSRALEIWNKSVLANPNHLYLRNKQILPFIVHQSGNQLVLPITDFNQKIWSIQFIYPDGCKKLLYGGAKKGHFISVNGFFSTLVLLICEGFATGATLAQAYPNACVIAAIDAGNLEYVAILARQHFPKSKIIVCADDDRETIGNPGMTKGRRASTAVGAVFASPQFPKNAPLSLTDFNDLACWLHNNGLGEQQCNN